MKNGEVGISLFLKTKGYHFKRMWMRSKMEEMHPRPGQQYRNLDVGPSVKAMLVSFVQSLSHRMCLLRIGGPVVCELRSTCQPIGNGY